MDFSLLTEYLDLLDVNLVPGIDLSVWKRHEPVYRHFSGYKDRENNIKLNGNEQYWIFSATKVFTVTAGMQCIEKGVFKLDDPVYKYLPAYKLLSVNDNGHIRAVTDPMTIRHLFTMTGGLNYNIESPSIQKAKLYSHNKADTLAMVNAFAEEPLDFYPGEHYRYSLCHDVLAGVIEAATKTKFSEYLRANIFEPLGVKNTGFSGEDLSRFAVQYTYDDRLKKSVPKENDCCYRLTDNYESGGAGLYSTVDDYILLCDALANGGEAATGKRILSNESVKLMATPQLSDEIRKNDFINHFGSSYTYALGVRVNCEEGSSSPIGEFGWDGAACAYNLMDPVNGVGAYLAMHVRSFGYGYEVIHHRIKDLIYKGLAK